MKNKTVATISLGCDKNRVDTETMLGSLSALGYIAGAEPEDADIIIINTCAFIKDAVDESLELINEMISLKKLGRCEKLVIAGCLPERDKQKLSDMFPEVDLLLGTGEFGNIASLLGHATRVKSTSTAGKRSTARMLTTMPWQAYLKIAEGCDNSCSYCLIPSLRGPFRSTPLPDVLDEAKALADMGVKEITLVAQDTTRYGSDSQDKGNLPRLLEQISGVRDIKWIRLMYAYPELVNNELIDAIARLDKVCNYIDMPIQHIDAQILKAMKRRGGPETIYRAIETLRNKIPDICIRTTLMTGFPGESDAAFKSLMQFVEEIKFDRMGVFAYSPEEGTTAAKMPGQIPEIIKQERLQSLMELQETISLNINKSLIGNTFEVLVEDVDEDDGERFCVGRTYRDAPDIDGLFFLDRIEEPGTFTRAKVIATGPHDLRGE